MPNALDDLFPSSPQPSRPTAAPSKGLPVDLFPESEFVPRETPPGYAVHVGDIPHYVVQAWPALKKWWNSPPAEPPKGAPEHDSYLGRITDIPGDVKGVLLEGVQAAAREFKRITEKAPAPGSIIPGSPLAGRGTPQQAEKLGGPSEGLTAFFDIVGAPAKGPMRSMVSRPVAEKLGTTPQAVESVTDFMLPGLGIVPYTRMGRLFVRPPNAARGFADIVGDDLNRLRTSATADRGELMNTVRQMPEETRTGAVQEALYDAIELADRNPARAMTELERLHPHLQDPAQMAQVVQAATNLHALRLEASNIYNNLRNLGIPDTDLVDPAYVHRRAVGHTPALDVAGPVVDPIAAAGGAQRTLPRTTSALQERRFQGGEAPSGDRVVISEDDAGQIVVHGGSHVPTGRGARIDDDHFTYNGQTFTIGSATTREIESATAGYQQPVTYYRNALANTVDALARLRAVQRHVEWLRNITATPDWTVFATRNERVARREGWHQPVGPPQVSEWYMHPRLEAAFNDFYRPGIAGRSGSDAQRLLDGLRRFNHFAVGSLFWQPTPHIENVMGHWVVGRGWDWITPRGARSLVVDGARAIRGVTTQNAEYRRLLREGSGMIFGGVANADFYQDVARLAGMQVAREPWRWDPIARVLNPLVRDIFPRGIGPSDLVRMWYSGMRRVLWWANDVFMMQRVLELERRMPVREAIREAEKHIPNYRIPTHVLGSRMFSQALQEPAISVFSRYHYGVFHSYANMIRDALGPNRNPQERFDAIGNMLALGLLTWVAYPAMSAGYQWLTGDPEAKKLARGPASIPTAIAELYEGDRSWPQTIAGSFTLAPGIRAGATIAGGGRDPFTGQPVTEPGSDAGRQVVQAADWAAAQVVQPWQLMGRRPEDEGGRSTGRMLLDQIVGAKDTSDAALHGQQVGKRVNRRRAIREQNHPRGMGERLIYGGPE